MKETEQPAHASLALALLELVNAVKEGAARVRGGGLVAGAAAAPPPDDEAVHDFRVALRRLRTLLRPARRVYGKKRIRAVDKELRRFAQATGALRDEEVLQQTLGALELPEASQKELTAWISLRAWKERALRLEVIHLLGKGAEKAPGARLAAPLKRLTGLLLHSKKVRLLSAGELAQRAAADALEGVREHAAAHPEDVAAMHALRIRFKRLRYTAELFAESLGEGAGAITKVATRMQRRLGDLHDLDEAIAKIQRARALSALTRVAALAALQATRVAASERTQRELGEAHGVLEQGFGDRAEAAGESESVE